MESDLLTFVLVGFAAQLIDGALGMAYGITATSLLLSTGVPPAAASATVHVAECFTSGVSAVSHHAFGNIDRDLVRRLVLPAVVGAVLGAYVLTSVPADAMRPIIAVYLLLMGVVIIVKAFRGFPPRSVTRHLAPLGLVGGFVDAAGGGGWGPIVASNLLARGAAIRTTVGSVIAVEFFVTTAASVAFIVMLGTIFWEIVLGLALGGLVAAPLGAWLASRLPARPFLVVVGLLIIGLSLRNLLV
ncbi:MAG: sulfite exporter TauE/SafE family protein [Pseudomonadales bacterium]